MAEKMGEDGGQSYNEGLRQELQHARKSLEALMQQTKAQQAAEDNRVERVRQEMEDCEAGLEKQLLEALVDGSGAKVEAKMAKENLAKMNERMSELENQLFQAGQDHKKVCGEHATELNQMDREVEAVCKAAQAEVDEIKEEKELLLAELSEYKIIVDSVDVQKVKEQLKKNNATARFMAVIQAALVANGVDQELKRLFVWNWKTNFLLVKATGGSTVSAMKQLSLIMKRKLNKGMGEALEAIREGARFEILMKGRFKNGEALFAKIRKRIQQNKMLGSLLNMKSSATVGAKAFKRVSAIKAEMVQMETDATYAIEKLEQDKATLVSNLNTLESSLEVVTESGETSATIQSLSRQLAELQTECIEIQDTADKTVTEVSKLEEKMRIESRELAEKSSIENQSLHEEMTHLQSKLRQKDREMERMKEDHEFTVQRINRSAEVSMKRAVADAIREERLMRSPSMLSPSPSSSPVKSKRGANTSHSSAVSSTSASKAPLVSKEQIILAELKREARDASMRSGRSLSRDSGVREESVSMPLYNREPYIGISVPRHGASMSVAQPNSALQAAGHHVSDKLTGPSELLVLEELLEAELGHQMAQGAIMATQ